MKQLSRTRVCALTLCLALAAAIAVVPPAAAHDPYTDSDSNYLKIVDYFTYPIGVALEWAVARPLHMLQTRGVQGFTAARTAQVGTVRVKRGCRSIRPPRYCTGARRF